MFRTAISAYTLCYHQFPAGRQDSTVLLAHASSFSVPVLLSAFLCLFPLGPWREDIEGMRGGLWLLWKAALHGLDLGLGPETASLLLGCQGRGLLLPLPKHTGSSFLPGPSQGKHSF